MEKSAVGNLSNYGSFDDYAEVDGSFLIKIFKGQTGKLRAEMTFRTELLEVCQEIKKAVIEKRSNETVTVATLWTEIKANQDVRDIKLTFPFPWCAARY